MPTEADVEVCIPRPSDGGDRHSVLGCRMLSGVHVSGGVEEWAL